MARARLTVSDCLATSRLVCSLHLHTPLSFCQHVTLKLYINSKAMGDQLDDEVKIYRRIEAGPRHHVGRSALRTLVDSFEVDGPDGQHRCLVHPPLFESVLHFLHRNPVRRLPSPILAFILQRTFQALQYLHTECQIIHTGIMEHENDTRVPK